MRTARFLVDGRYHEGRLDGDRLVDEAGRRHPAAAVTFLPPVQPTHIIGLALNYADHADELRMQPPTQPAIFFKPINTLVGHRAPVISPPGVAYMHYENEVAVVIGRRARRVRAADAFAVIGGYTVANDLTVRDFVHDFFRPPVKAKGWDTFLPLGPYLVSGEVEDPDNLELVTTVNGEERQRGNTRDLIIRIPELIEHITEFMTLEPGDVLLTGTPKGISHVHPGDLMRLEVAGVGVLENRVVAEAQE